MAHLWFRMEGDEMWSAMPVNGHVVNIHVFPPQALPEEFCLGDEGAVVLQASSGSPAIWALVAGASSEVRVNGLVPVAGLRVLEDHDEIRTAAGQLLFFSTETLATVIEFPGAEPAIYCGRCRQRMEKGEACVRCPQCAVWYHETESLPCWTYSPTCGSCPRATVFDAGFSWVPED